MVPEALTDRSAKNTLFLRAGLEDLILEGWLILMRTGKRDYLDGAGRRYGAVQVLHQGGRTLDCFRKATLKIRQWALDASFDRY